MSCRKCSLVNSIYFSPTELAAREEAERLRQLRAELEGRYIYHFEVYAANNLNCNIYIITFIVSVYKCSLKTKNSLPKTKFSQ